MTTAAKKATKKTAAKKRTKQITIRLTGKKKLTKSRHHIKCPKCGNPFPIDVVPGP